MHRLGRALQPLLDPRAGHDRGAVAEAQTGAEGAVLVPQTVELSVKSVDCFFDVGVVLGGEAVPELGTLLAQALDLRMDS